MSTPANDPGAPARNPRAGPPARTGRRASSVLVVSDNADDLRQIVRVLENDHEHVQGAQDVERAVEAFEALLPQVVVLAFDQIQKSDQLLLGIYRRSTAASAHVHRTVLLCGQQEARAAYELCKKDCYDDYVLYWPMAQDGMRLSMSVWNAAREVAAQLARPNAKQLIAYTEQVRGVETFFEHEAVEAQRISRTVTSAMAKVESALDEAIDNLKQEGVRQAFHEGRAAIGEAASWPVQATRRLESIASQARGLAGSLARPSATVMVVDDDPLQRDLIAAALSGRDIELLMLSDGASLVGAIRRRKPDMILMDINLPDLSGLALTRMAKALPRLAGVPVLMLTAESSRDALAKSIEAGAVGYIVKPFTRATLLKNIERFLPAAAASPA